MCYLLRLPKSKDYASSYAVAASPRPAGVAAVAEDKSPQVQKIKTAVAGDDDESYKEVAVSGDDDEGYNEVAVAVAPKSSLKRPNWVGSKNVVKDNVKWMDLLGKDLTEVKEFEASESGEADDEDGNTYYACTCVIQ